jgi:hypothetical protein
MSGTEIALIITALGTFMTSLGSVLVSVRNSRKLDAVHESTNGLSIRAETLAKALGVEQGKAAEKANHT